MEDLLERAVIFLRPGILVFNGLQLYYLSFTVLFYAESRTRSIRLASAALFTAASFFAVYLFLSLPGPVHVPNFVWFAAVLALVILPLSWYLIVLYYLGVSGIRPLRRSSLHAPGVLISFFLLLLLAPALFSAGPMPEARSVIEGNLRPRAYGAVLSVFAAYLMVSTGLALAALFSPSGSSAGSAGTGIKHLARRRAMPAMRIASGALFAVALLVLGIVLRLLLDGNFERAGRVVSARHLFNMDVPAAILISISIVASGRGIISYELFSERALPRQGIFRHWRILVVYAVFLGFTASLAASVNRQAAGLVFLTGLLGILFFTALGRRTTRDLKKHIRLLRPLSGAAEGTGESLIQDAQIAFRALVRDVLGARAAYLHPLGAAAPLAGDPLVYPEEEGREEPLPDPTEILEGVNSPGEMYVETDPERFGGAMVAVPLWNARGRTGVLLLREKTNGDIYTQEEAEIAQAAGERIMESLTGARMSRMLLSLQEEKLVENKLADHRARRVLHDDILPEIHAIMLENSADRAEMLRRLSSVHGEISNLLREMPANPNSELERGGLVQALRNLAPGEETEVEHDFQREAEEFCETLRPRTRDVLYYAVREAVRNALRYGAPIEPTPDADGHASAGGNVDENRERSRILISLRYESNKGLEIMVRDNGPALRAAMVSSPLSSPLPSSLSADIPKSNEPRENKGGAGRGLSLHGAMVAVVGGSMHLETEPSAFTRVIIRLPSEA